MSRLYQNSKGDLYVTTNKTPVVGDDVLVKPEVLRKRKMIHNRTSNKTPVKFRVLAYKVRASDGIPIILIQIGERSAWLDPTEYKTISGTVYETEKDIPEVGDVYFVKRGSLKGVVGIITEVTHLRGCDYPRVTLKDLANDKYHVNIPYGKADLKLVICHTKGTVSTIGDITEGDHVLYVSASPNNRSSMLGTVLQVEAEKNPNRHLVAGHGGWRSVNSQRLVLVKKRVKEKTLSKPQYSEVVETVSYPKLKTGISRFQEKIHSIEAQLASLKYDIDEAYRRGYEAGQETAYQNGYKDGRASNSNQLALKYVMTNEHDERAAAERVAEQIRNKIVATPSNTEYVYLPIPKVVSRNNKRQRLITKAKRGFEAEVETLRNLGKEVNVSVKGDYETGKEISVEVYETGLGGFIYFGEASCSPSDCFNLYVGRYIALLRALKKDYPEFANGLPKAVRVGVGNVILYIANDDEVVELTVVENEGVYDSRLHIPLKNIEPKRIVQILDDTEL